MGVNAIFERSTGPELKNYYREILKINRLPEEDFESRVRVGIVTFNTQAQVEFPLGKAETKYGVGFHPPTYVYLKF